MKTWLISALLCCALPACAQTTYTEINTASDLTTDQTCNAQATRGTNAPMVLQVGGGGFVAISFSQVKNVSRTWEVYTAANKPNSTTWASGTYTAQVDVTAASASASMIISAVCILRVNSAGTVQATICSSTGLSVALNTTGNKTVTIAAGCGAQAAAATDRLCVAWVFTNNSAATQTWSVQTWDSTNSTVAVPWNENVTSGCAHALTLLHIGCASGRSRKRTAVSERTD